AGGRHEGAGGRHLPRRHRHPAALLRGARPGAARRIGDQETLRSARADHPGIRDRRSRPDDGRAPRRLPGRPAWRADLRRPGVRPDGASHGMTGSAAPRLERVLILAPLGRDAQVAARILTDAEAAPTLVCDDITALLHALEEGAAAAIIAEEALHGTDA